MILAFELPLPVVLLGIVSGMTYGILAVGLVLIYRSNRIVNFAHGEVGALAAAAAGVWVVKLGLPYWLAFAGALVVGAGSSMLIEVIAIRRLRRAPKVMSIVATLGASTFLLVLSLALNTQVRRGADYPQPPGLPSMEIDSLVLTPAYTAMLIFTPVLVIALGIFLRRSVYGVAIRAAADNPDAATMAGISTKRMSGVAWGIAGAVSAYTAILQFPSKGFIVTGQSLGPGLLVRALVCSVVARMVNLPAALAAGVAVGVVEQGLLWNNPSGGQVEAVLFAIMLAALLVQSRQGSREQEQGSWVAMEADEPLPERYQRVWAIRNLGRIGLGVLGVGLVSVLLTTNRAAAIFTMIVGFTIIGLSVYIVSGLAGQVSLGQFALAGVGAVVSIKVVRYGTGFPLSFLAAGAGAAVVSLVIGLPALRIRGLLLSVVTLAFAVMSEAWLFQQDWAVGAGTDPGRPIIGNTVLATAKQYYLFALPWLAVALWLASNVRRGGIGRSLVALRDNEDAARAFGVRAAASKLRTFALGGFLAGIGGAVYAHSAARVVASTFPAGTSIKVVAMSVIGGLSIVSGPLFGALYLFALPAFVPFDSAGLAASELGWLLLILYFPGGLAQMVRPLRARVIGYLARRAGVDDDVEEADVDPDAARQPVALREGRLAGEAEPRLHAAAREGDEDDGVLLRVEHLGRRFGGVVAVDDVSLEVRAGETFGLIGPNGAGKTTLFELISGFTRADTGRVSFQGIDVTHWIPEDRAAVGVVRSFQDARLFPTLTVLDVVRLAHEVQTPTRFVQSLAGLPTEGRRERAKDEAARALVALMGLEDYRNKRVGELSTGTRRITELACCLALRPRLLLLDEPAAGIAQRETEALAGVLQSIKAHADTTIIVIEHDIPLIMGISDRVAAMESGRIIKIGTPAEVRDDPAVIESYLGGSLEAIERSGRRPTGTNGTVVVRGTCVAVTKAGTPCRRPAGPDGRCAQHQQQDEAPSNGRMPPEPVSRIVGPR